MDLVGQQVREYRIEEEIGVGGMGAVYKAYDPTVNRYVAVKVILPQFSQDDLFRERFDREATAIAHVEHPHILPIYAYGEQNDLLYLVLRWVPRSLNDYIEEVGPLPLGEVVRLLKEMAEALDFAHSHDILHRDFKSENVLLDDNGHAYLSDFGLSKMMSNASRLSGGLIVGTPTFMSPEQAAGEMDLTPASDQYALGICLYHMLTNRLPFDGAHPLAVIQKQIYGQHEDPRTYREELPELAARAIDRALAKEPDARFPDCTTFASTFANALEGSGLSKLRTGRLPGSIVARIDSALSQVQLDEEEDDTPPED